MGMLPFDYNTWSMNKDSIECMSMGVPVYSLKQHEHPDGIRLVGYVSKGSQFISEYRLAEWDINGDDTVMPTVPEYKLKLKMKLKDK